MRRSQTLVLRVDADVRKGTGHFMRCLGLAQAWQSFAGGGAIFCSRALADVLTGTRFVDLPDVVHDASQFYWGDVEKYLAEGRIYGDDAVAAMMPPCRVQDVDTPEDWLRVGLIFEALESNE